MEDSRNLPAAQRVAMASTAKRKQMASDKKSPESIQHALLDLDGPFLADLLALNSGVFPSVQERLMLGRESTRGLLARNLYTVPSIQEVLARDVSSKVRMSLAQNLYLAPGVEDVLREDADPVVTAALATGPLNYYRTLPVTKIVETITLDGLARLMPDLSGEERDLAPEWTKTMRELREALSLVSR